MVPSFLVALVAPLSLAAWLIQVEGPGSGSTGTPQEFGDSADEARRAGGPSAEDLKVLVDRYTPNLMRASLSLGFNVAEAEELIQDTFVAFLTGGKRFEGKSRLLTYLFGILYNKARETRRLNDREQATDIIEEVFDNHFDSDGHWNEFTMREMSEPERHTQTLEIAKSLEICLQMLNAQMRMAFTMKEVEGLSTEAICDMLKVTPTHLNVLLFRARNRLRECLLTRGISIA